MFFVFLFIAFIVIASALLVICGASGSDAIEIAPLPPITPTFVSRDYSF